MAGAAVRTIGTSADKTGKSLRTAGRHGFFFSQAMFTLRRAVYHGTQTLGLLAGAVAFVGIKFNSTMEQQRLAFSRFMGSRVAAQRELNFLFELAAKTPFEFEQVLSATRQLMAFGFTAKATNYILRQLSDAVAAMGLDQSALDRATLALGQIRASGRLLGQDLRQLMQLGLIDPTFLRKRFNLTPEQMGNIGKAMIPSEQAIDAITDYWRMRFSGSAKAFQGTLQGALSTARDYGTRLFGTIMQPLTQRLERDILPVFSRIAQRGQGAYRRQGIVGILGLTDVEIKRATGYTTHLAQTFKVLRDFVLALAGALTPLVKAFVSFFIIFRPTIRLLQVATPLINAFGWVLRKLQWPLYVVINLLLLERVVLILNTAQLKLRVFWGMLVAAVERRKAFWTRVSTGETVRSNIVQRLAVLWSLRKVTATNLETVMLNRHLRMTRLNIMAIALFAWIQGIATAAMVVFTTAGGGLAGVLAVLRWGFLGLTSAIWTSIVAITTFLVTNPIGWAILIIAALVLLYWKWKWFHNLVNEVFFWIKDHWKLLAPILLGPFWLLAAFVISHFDFIKQKIQGILDWVKSKFGWLTKAFSKIGGLLGFGGAPGGGMDAMLGAGQGGLSPLLPGQSGADLGLLYPPRRGGQAVTPGTLQPVVLPKGKFVQQVVTPVAVKIDRREIAKATALVNLDEDARR